MRFSAILSLAAWTCLVMSCESSFERAAEDAERRASAAEARLSGVTTERDELKEKLSRAGTELKAFRAGHTPTYLVTLHVSQTHFTLSLKEHLKDAMNAFDMEVPVSKEFFDGVHVGEDVEGKFRWGSLLVRGSLGTWSVTCTGKRVSE